MVSLLAQAGGPPQEVQPAPGPEIQEPGPEIHEPGGAPAGQKQAEELEALSKEVLALREQLQAQNQQVQEVQEQLQTQNEAVANLQDYEATQVEQREARELSRQDRIVGVDAAVNAVRSVRQAVELGQADVTEQLDEAISLLDAETANAAQWGENEQADLLGQSRTSLAAVPTFLDERDFTEAKGALFMAELNAVAALNLAQAVEQPEQ